METLIVSGQIPPTPLRLHRRASPVRRTQSLGFHRRASPSRRTQSVPFHRRIVAAANLSSQTQTQEPPPKSPNRMLILGMGLVGKSIADEFKNKGWDVQGTCNSSWRKKMFEARGFENVHIFNRDKPELSTLNAMKGCTHLLVGSPSIGSATIRHEELLRSVFMGGDLKWLCFLSTINVYGDHGDAWIDEDSTTNPETESAEMRLIAEEAWLKLGDDLGLPASVFRLGSVYGPGISPLDIIIKDGPLSKTQMMNVSGKYTSRVHVEDICRALEASIVKPTDRKVYNIVDDNPAPQEEVFVYAQNLIDKKWPGRMRRLPFPASYIPVKNEMAEKRVSNARMKNELGVSLRYPSYESGLQSIIDQMEDPFKDEESVDE